MVPSRGAGRGGSCLDGRPGDGPELAAPPLRPADPAAAEAAVGGDTPRGSGPPPLVPPAVPVPPRRGGSPASPSASNWPCRRAAAVWRADRRRACARRRRASRCSCCRRADGVRYADAGRVPCGSVPDMATVVVVDADVDDASSRRRSVCTIAAAATDGDASDRDGPSTVRYPLCTDWECDPDASTGSDCASGGAIATPVMAWAVPGPVARIPGAATGAAAAVDAPATPTGCAPYGGLPCTKRLPPASGGRPAPAGCGGPRGAAAGSVTSRPGGASHDAHRARTGPGGR